jgi:hypothetical protein
MGQVLGIGGIEVFGYALAVGDKQKRQLIANQAIQNRRDQGRFISLGHNHRLNFLGGICPVMQHDHVFLCAQIGGRAHHQNPMRICRALCQELGLIHHQGIALAHACGIQKHDLTFGGFFKLGG